MKIKNLVQQVVATGVSVTVLLIFSLVSLQTAGAEEIRIQVILSGQLGTKVGSFGGLTLDELKKKDDPLAYGTSSAPQDFAIDSKGDIIIADGENHRIQKFSKNGTCLFSLGKCSDVALKWPFRVAVNQKDEIIVGEETDGIFCIYTAEGDFVAKIDGQQIDREFSINDIKVDSRNNVYVYAAIGRVFVFDAHGIFLKSFYSQYLAIDPKGNLWSFAVDDAKGDTLKFHPNDNKEYVDFLGIDNDGKFYLLVNIKEEEHLLIQDENGNVKAKIRATINGYRVIRWKIAPEGDIYALGISDNSKEDFLRLFKIAVSPTR